MNVCHNNCKNGYYKDEETKIYFKKNLERSFHDENN